MVGVEYMLIEDELSFAEESGGVYRSAKDFTSLVVWQNCRDVKSFFYQEILPSLPVEEKYGLASQIRRAAVSTTANIAEGYGRFHYKECIQYCRISRGSLSELKDHLITCFDLEFISESTYSAGLELIEQAKVTSNGYIRYLQKQLSS